MLELARRSLVMGCIAWCGVVASCPGLAEVAEGPPSVRCAGPLRPTPAQTEGPFFKPGSPRRFDLTSPGLAGERVVLTGRVLTRSCRPLQGARIEVWQADPTGRYDNRGYTLRGHEFTDGDGRYRFVTVLPGEYPGRTRHIHLKIAAPGRPALITQVYFPGESRNREDGIFDPALTVSLRRVADEAGRPSLAAGYDFVLDLP